MRKRSTNISPSFQHGMILQVRLLEENDLMNGDDAPPLNSHGEPSPANPEVSISNGMSSISVPIEEVLRWAAMERAKEISKDGIYRDGYEGAVRDDEDDEPADDWKK